MPDRTQTLSVAGRLIEILDSEFERQAQGRPGGNDYQIGFDAGINEVKKILLHPNVQIAHSFLSQPEHQGEDPVERRERAVSELLDLAKVADNDGMRDQLEGLASRFSLPPSAQPPAPALSDEDRERLLNIAGEPGTLFYSDRQFLRKLASRGQDGP